MCTFSIEEYIPDEIRNNISSPSLQRQIISNYQLQSSDHTINVLSWNILAQALSYPKGNFNRVKNEMVTYETRRWRILEQILHYQPDLCSLQEVDIYDCFLKEQLSKYGYGCFFTEKPNSRCLSFRHDAENFKGSDGNLLCYKTNKFKEIARKNSSLPNDGRHGQQVFSILELEYIPFSSRLIFIGTHLKAKTQFASSRVNQVNAILDYIRKEYSQDTNIILAGDFNGEPDESFYNILINANLMSSYRYLLNNHEPPYTTWKFKSRESHNEKEESRTIDYIFYRSNRLTPIAYLNIPSKTDIGPDGLPCASYPSDHLALQSIFLIQK